MQHCKFQPIIGFFFLLQCLAHMEAFIDFSEGELIEEGVLNQGASLKNKNKNST